MASDRWRDRECSSSAAPAETARSKGINPSSFYKKLRNNENPTAAEKQLGDILNLAAREEIVQQRHGFTAAQKLRQEAYNAVTSFKVFPLQDLAMDYLSEMAAEYLGDSKMTIQPQPYGAKFLSADGVDLHELSSDHYCKRRRIDCMNNLRMKYTDIFLAERYYLPPSDTEQNDQICRTSKDTIEKYCFLPELWSMEPRIFAVETSSTGKRKYIVGNLGRFLQYYWREIEPRSRHFYELIPENTPCRLFFDLEFCKESNPQISVDETEVLITEFIDELGVEFKLAFGIQINRSCVVDLDASTDKKFSRHLIIHLPNSELFADAYSAGVFAKRLVGRLAEELSTGTLEDRHVTLAKSLFVNKPVPKTTPPKQGTDNNNSTCFVDLGVYTRNRLFRLMGSAKFGKHASSALRLANANTFCFPVGFDNSKFYQTDPVPPDATNVDRPDASRDIDPIRDHDTFCAAFDWETHARALSLTLVVPSNASKIITPVLAESMDGCKIPVKSSESFVSRRHKPSTSLSCNGDSPIPKLDEFILSLSRRGGVQGKIRVWSLVESNYMSYQMSDNRWCENIGRAHKSNNIIWNTDLKCKTYWQTCHDPECRAANYRGSTMELPADVSTAVSEYLLDQELASIDEEKIIRDAKKLNTCATHSKDFSDPELDQALGDLDMSLFS